MFTSARSCDARAWSNADTGALRSQLGELLDRGTICEAKTRQGIRGLPVASASHFDLGGKASSAAFGRSAALPYCFDFDRKELIYTLHDDIRQILAEPFLHAAQRKFVRAIVRLPLSCLDDMLGPAEPELEPSLVFSIGRCGSTLLHGLARIFTPQSYSEPDTLTQLAKPATGALLDWSKQKLVWWALAPFIAGAGPASTVVKFRSQVNQLASEIAQSFPRAKYFFIFRGRDDWARSIYRTFGKSPVGAAQRLRGGVRAADVLLTSGSDFEIIHYEALVSSPLSVLARMFGEPALQHPGSKAAVAELLKHDAQRGTALAREELPTRADEELWLQSFRAEWAKIRPAKLLQRLNLEL